jgi:hypothetical protein
MEKIIETNLSYLPIEDKQHCDIVFEIYSSHVAHVSEILQLIENKNYQFQNNRNSDTDKQLFSLLDIHKAKEVLKDILETLTQSLILKLENYFAKKYCLAFTSLIPDRGNINLNPVSSCDAIIENIMGQVGADLLEAGKQQIKLRFLKSFYKKSLPSLKGNKISIPSFICIDEHYGDKLSLSYTHNKRLENLINALNLFLNDSTELPKNIINKLAEWKGYIELSESYPVFPDVSFKFFKNQRIDLTFSDSITARKFWNYYALEIIEKFIQEND